MHNTTKKKTIACLGDSITFGHGVSATRMKDAWPFVLQRMLGDGFTVLNFGINGATARKDTPDSYERSGPLDNALISGADIFILMLGTNDTKERYWNAQLYEAGLRSIIERIAAAIPEKLYLMLPPKAFAGPSGETAYGINDRTLTTEVIPTIRKLAEEYICGIIDLYALTKDHPEYYLEGVHPGVSGNRAIAECVYWAIK